MQYCLDPLGKHCTGIFWDYIAQLKSYVVLSLRLQTTLYKKDSYSMLP